MKKNMKCFLSASSDTNIDILRQILLENGIIPFSSYDVDFQTSIIQFLKSKIKEADFAVAIISKMDMNVFYEIGICAAYNKPLFLIVDKKLNLPLFLQGSMHLKASLDDKDIFKISTLNNSILRFAEDVKNKKNLFRAQNKLPIIKNLKINFVNKVQKLRKEGSGFELEKFATEVFRALDIQYVSNIESQDKGIDFVIWNESLDFHLGNPIFVEIKYGLLTNKRIQETEKQLQGYIGETEAKAGLLLYLDKEGKRFRQPYSLNPLIIRWDFEDFIKEVSKNDFNKAILNKRNNMVHGIED